MKKILMTLMLAVLLVIPMETIALAEPVEAPVPDAPVEIFIHGDVPAETAMTDSMTPALHAVVLAMVNHDEESFSVENTDLAWESLYNMVSLYGQMDNRSDYQGDDLLLPSETVSDYSSALFSAPVSGEVPEAVADRMTYLADEDSWLVVCGEDGLSEIRISETSTLDGVIYVSGELVYLVDDSSLAQFEAVLLPQDNLLGCTLLALDLV